MTNLSPRESRRARIAAVLDGTPAAIVALLVAVCGCAALMAASFTRLIT
jgi:hypothetical protein